MMMQNFASMGLITVMWFLFVFSLCFGHTYWFWGSITTFGAFHNVNGSPLAHTAIGDTHPAGTIVGDIPGLVFAGYQGMFAVITPALMTGAFADRLKFAPYLIFIALWIVFVYAPFCHWVWGGGWMAEWGIKDFAGGIVVHTTAGFSALAAVHVLGSRAKIEGSDPDNTPHNIPFVGLGTALLWFGWFGFNGGSALASTGGAAYAAVNSEIAASTALSVWVLIEWIRFGKPSMVGLCVGAIAGLATITPCAGFVRPWAAFVIGIVAALFCYASCELKNKASWDDALDVRPRAAAASCAQAFRAPCAQAKEPRLPPRQSTLPAPVFPLRRARHALPGRQTLHQPSDQGAVLAPVRAPGIRPVRGVWAGDALQPGI